MFHRIISTIGLDILGIDPFTALYMIGMGVKKDKKSRISLFWFSVAIFSVLIGAILAVTVGASAVEFFEKNIPGDDSPFWAFLNLGISIVILV